MKTPTLYRKRLIPQECILLNDEVLHRDAKHIVTRWSTIRPKKTLDHGSSCYFLEKGFKLSKFYDAEGRLLYWYFDIVSFHYEPETDTYTVTDLLADVIVETNGFVKVVDLDELADALEEGLLSQETAQQALRQLNSLLSLIYQGGLSRLTALLDELENR